MKILRNKIETSSHKLSDLPIPYAFVYWKYFADATVIHGHSARTVVSSERLAVADSTKDYTIFRPSLPNT